MFSDTNSTIPHVLIIEKGNALMDELAGHLGSSYRFSQASTIDTALTIIRENGIHGILLDVQSFGIDEGFLGTRRIKATNSNGKLPVIAILPEADPGLKTDSLLAGCTTFIIRPFTLKALSTVIAEVLNLTDAYRTPARSRNAVSQNM